MIGIDRVTGRTLRDYEQLVSRVTQVMTTPLGGRIKRPRFGSRVREALNSNLSDSLLVKVQSYAIEAFYNPANGLQDFNPTRCVARRHSTGLHLYFEGHWQARSIQFKVPIDVSTQSATA